MANISLEKVCKTFGDAVIIPGADLEITDGEFIIFVGPSGCGKSTLLRLIAGLEDLTSGNIKIGGRDVSDVSPSGRKLSMVFQSYALYPHMSVRDNIAFPLKMAKMSQPEIDAKVAKAAESLNLTSIWTEGLANCLAANDNAWLSVARLCANLKAFCLMNPCQIWMLLCV